MDFAEFNLAMMAILRFAFQPPGQGFADSTRGFGPP
jgi:hypothetical protein